jgi:hypothetical protein
MNNDPLSEVIDEPLSVSAETLKQLKMLRATVNFADLPSKDIAEEQARLSQAFNELLDSLIAGVAIKPSKLWVMSQFQSTLEGKLWIFCIL